MRRILLGILGVALGLAASAAQASAADEIPPVSSEIVTSTAPVSWPESPAFEYRVNFRSGPSGADFTFSVKEPYWGFGDRVTYGSPFGLGQPSLDGSGTLDFIGGSHGDPAPWSCFRGARGNYSNWYALEMPPDSSTTVVVPASLGSAPLARMDQATTLTVGQAFPVPEANRFSAAAPNITGKYGVRIISRVIGSKDHLVRRKAGKTFRLAGYTRPAIANRKLVISGQSRFGGFGRPALDLARLGTVRTDDKGRFRSKRLQINGDGLWLTYARPARPSRFAIENSCGPAIDFRDSNVGSTSSPATFEMLDGTNWKSVKIKGNGKKPKKIELYFTEGQANWADNEEEIDETVPILGTWAGCNWMGANYRIAQGRVKWTSPAYGTAMACIPDRSRWILKRLRLGLQITMEGKFLVLRRGQAVVRLKPAPARA